MPSISYLNKTSQTEVISESSSPNRNLFLLSLNQKFKRSPHFLCKNKNRKIYVRS